MCEIEIIVVFLIIGIVLLPRLYRLTFGYSYTFRIIKEINNLNDGSSESICYYIEKRGNLGWGRINLIEYNTHVIEFTSLEAAEECLFTKYLKYAGTMTINGNIYIFKAHTIYY